MEILEHWYEGRVDACLFMDRLIEALGKWDGSKNLSVELMEKMDLNPMEADEVAAVFFPLAYDDDLKQVPVLLDQIKEMEGKIGQIKMASLEKAKKLYGDHMETKAKMIEAETI